MPKLYEVMVAVAKQQWGDETLDPAEHPDVQVILDLCEVIVSGGDDESDHIDDLNAWIHLLEDARDNYVDGLQSEEVTIYAVVGQYNLSRMDAGRLAHADVAYYCGEQQGVCPFHSFPDEPEAICPFWHFTADFQDKHNDDFNAMCDEVDSIVGLKGQVIMDVKVGDQVTDRYQHYPYDKDTRKHIPGMAGTVEELRENGDAMVKFPNGQRANLNKGRYVRLG